MAAPLYAINIDFMVAGFKFDKNLEVRSTYKGRAKVLQLIPRNYKRSLSHFHWKKLNPQKLLHSKQFLISSPINGFTECSNCSALQLRYKPENMHMETLPKAEALDVYLLCLKKQKNGKK